MIDMTLEELIGGVLIGPLPPKPTPPQQQDGALRDAVKKAIEERKDSSADPPKPRD